MNLSTGKICRVYLKHGTRIVDSIAGVLKDRDDDYIILTVIPFNGEETIYIPHENVAYVAIEEVNLPEDER